MLGTLLARIGPGLEPHVEGVLRSRGEGPLLDLEARLAAAGAWRELAGSSIEQVLGALWPDLAALAKV